MATIAPVSPKITFAQRLEGCLPDDIRKDPKTKQLIPIVSAAVLSKNFARKTLTYPDIELLLTQAIASSHKEMDPAASKKLAKSFSLAVADVFKMPGTLRKKDKVSSPAQDVILERLKHRLPAELCNALNKKGVFAAVSKGFAGKVPTYPEIKAIVSEAMKVFETEMDPESLAILSEKISSEIASSFGISIPSKEPPAPLKKQDSCTVS